MNTLKIDPNKEITDVTMFDGDSNVQLGGDLLKFYYPKLIVMHGVKHKNYLLFNDLSKTPKANQTIQDNKAI